MHDTAGRLTVEVTEEDIANGKSNEPRECPVAFAVRRALHEASVEFDDLSVQYSRLEIWTKTPEFELEDPSITVTLPPMASDFIDAFDGMEGDLVVSPITFDIFVPELVR